VCMAQCVLLKATLGAPSSSHGSRQLSARSKTQLCAAALSLALRRVRLSEDSLRLFGELCFSTDSATQVLCEFSCGALQSTRRHTHCATNNLRASRCRCAARYSNRAVLQVRTPSTRHYKTHVARRRRAAVGGLEPLRGDAERHAGSARRDRRRRRGGALVDVGIVDRESVYARRVHWGAMPFAVECDDSAGVEGCWAVGGGTAEWWWTLWEGCVGGVVCSEGY